MKLGVVHPVCVLYALRMDIETLARKAEEIVSETSYADRERGGEDAGNGFTYLYNFSTGQSKTVLHHAESGLVFKMDHYGEVDEANSGRVLGSIEIKGTVYPVRLPVWYSFPAASGDGFVVAQEFVGGHYHDECGASWDCSHTAEMRRVTKCLDTHTGNWKICNGEVVLFDFDGIEL